MTALRLTTSAKATGAFPPIYSPPTMAQWCEMHHAPRRGWLARLLPTASPDPTGSSHSAQVVEAGLGANRGDG